MTAKQNPNHHFKCNDMFAIREKVICFPHVINSRCDSAVGIIILKFRRDNRRHNWGAFIEKLMEAAKLYLNIRKELCVTLSRQQFFLVTRPITTKSLICYEKWILFTVHGMLWKLYFPHLPTTLHNHKQHYVDCMHITASRALKYLSLTVTVYLSFNFYVFAIRLMIFLKCQNEVKWNSKPLYHISNYQQQGVTIIFTYSKLIC